MKLKYIIAILLVICSAIILWTRTLEAQAIPAPVVPIVIHEKKVEVEKTYLEMVKEIAPKFGQDPNLLAEVIYNESGFQVKSHDKGRAKNITAIHDSTFRGWLPKYEKQMGETLDINSQYDSIKMMAWAFDQGESYRRQWTTYRACQNPSGVFSFYSNLLGQHFTIKCKPVPAKYII